MQFSEITEESVRNISDKELLGLHYRLHQHRGRVKDETRLIFIKEKHKIIINEMSRRLKEHKSPMIIQALKKLRGKSDFNIV